MIKESRKETIAQLCAERNKLQSKIDGEIIKQISDEIRLWNCEVIFELFQKASTRLFSEDTQKFHTRIMEILRCGVDK